MELKQLARTPQLIKITLDDEDIVKEYGEPLDFWIYDRQPMEQFLKIATNEKKDISVLVDTLKTMVLDANGDTVIKDGLTLPSKVLLSTFSKIVEELGK